MKNFENRLNKLEKGFGKLPDFDTMAKDLFFTFMEVMESVPVKDPKPKQSQKKKMRKRKFMLSSEPLFQKFKKDLAHAYYR
jgi:hypothetical protein